MPSGKEGAGRQLAREFLRFALETGLLCVGGFTTKSGRASPYFFNTGLAADGASVSALAGYYVRAAQLYGLRFDSLFGSAYKGIALAAAIAIELARGDPMRRTPFAFNRKEAKSHGDAGALVGRLAGNVLIVDDVITSGMSIGEADAHVRSAGATPCCVLVALDRMECAPGGEPGETAAAALARKLGLYVGSIASAEDLRALLDEEGRPGEAARIAEQIRRYGPQSDGTGAG